MQQSLSSSQSSPVTSLSDPLCFVLQVMSDTRFVPLSLYVFFKSNSLFIKFIGNYWINSMLAGEREREKEREREMILQVLLPYLFYPGVCKQSYYLLVTRGHNDRTESAKGDHLSYGV